MTITVKFFASLREQTGNDELQLIHESGMTVLDAWRLAATRTELPRNTLCAVNMEYAKFNQPITDGDEVAFFPPVTGG